LGNTVLDAQEIQKVVPPEYHDFLLLFLEGGLRWLPPKRPNIDHEITPIPDFQSPFRHLYGLLQAGLKAHKKWLDDNLKKGFIRPSSFLAAFPMLFVKKKEGRLRPSIDYWKLNQGTIKGRYPLPLITAILAWLSKAKYISKIDIHDTYSLIRV
jgi:hypothetical protein